jgi:hypothetical protein
LIVIRASSLSTVRQSAQCCRIADPSLGHMHLLGCPVVKPTPHKRPMARR